MIENNLYTTHNALILNETPPTVYHTVYSQEPYASV